MNDDPLSRLPRAFGQVLARHRRERKLSCHALANAACLSKESDIIIGLECGDFGPTLTDFFRIALALGVDPVLLFVDLVAAWRGDDADRSMYPSRASSFERLYRLGYYHKIGDFRELERTYGSIPEAISVAERLNAQRNARGVRLLDTVTTYVRLQCAHFVWKPDERKDRQ
jgi:hypothetical protein